jgi:hypothetical protein
MSSIFFFPDPSACLSLVGHDVAAAGAKWPFWVVQAVRIAVLRVPSRPCGPKREISVRVKLSGGEAIVGRGTLAYLPVNHSSIITQGKRRRPRQTKAVSGPDGTSATGQRGRPKWFAMVL